jgi:hypothetical protein
MLYCTDKRHEGIAVIRLVTEASQYRKVHGNLASKGTLGHRETVEAIVKVNEPGYVPDAVRVRARIDPLMITGEARTEDLMELELDPKVVSVSVGRRLRVID